MKDNFDVQKIAEFIVIIDRLKSVLRRSQITDCTRRENSAEHSWHLAMMAATLAPCAKQPIDLLRVITMVLVHDLGELEVGDVFLYDGAQRQEAAAREAEAARKLFAQLPAEQGKQLLGAWNEFNARETAEAKFANALDRLQPIILAMRTGAKAWQENRLSRADVLRRNAHIEEGAPALWAYTQQLVEQAVEQGYLLP